MTAPGLAATAIQWRARTTIREYVEGRGQPILGTGLCAIGALQRPFET